MSAGSDRRSLAPGARVAVTGIGILSPLGLSTAAHWEGLLAGRSGVRPVTHFPVEGLRTRFAGQLPGFVPEGLTDSQVGMTDRFAQMAVAASLAALRDARLRPGEDGLAPERVGLVLGTAQGGRIADEELMETYFRTEGRRVRPVAVPLVMPSAGAVWSSLVTGARGPLVPISNACASGLQGIGLAAAWLRSGAPVDVFLAGASDAPVTRTMLAAWCAARATSARNDDPAAASRPFDRTRDGLVLAEGAAVVVLERLDAALARGARVYAEILGHGHSADAHDITAPDPGGAGPAAAMRAALADAGVSPGEVELLSAHGTSTRLNDAVEAKAIRTVWGDVGPAVCAVKSATGHAMGASGAIEAATAALAVHHGTAPPTRNLDEPDADCALDHVRGERRSLAGGAAVVNAFAFGGANSSLVLAPWA